MLRFKPSLNKKLKLNQYLTWENPQDEKLSFMGKNVSLNSQLILTGTQTLRSETNNLGEIYYILASKVVRS